MEFIYTFTSFSEKKKLFSHCVCLPLCLSISSSEYVVSSAPSVVIYDCVICNELSQRGYNDQCMRCRILRHSLCLTCIKRHQSSFALSFPTGEWRWEEASVLQDYSDAAESPAGGQDIAPSFPHCLHPLQPALLGMLHGTGRLTAFLSLCMPSCDHFLSVPVFNFLWCVLSQRINYIKILKKVGDIWFIIACNCIKMMLRQHIYHQLTHF